MKNKSKFLKIAMLAAKKAGKNSLKYFNKKLDINFKEGNEIVTNVDKENEEIIKKIIKKNFPKHSIWAEESKEEKRNSDYTWYIDPIDGTYIYSKGIPLYGIIIGLEYKRKTIMGIHYFPALNDIYYAEEGKGAWKNKTRIKVKEQKDKKDFFLMTSAFLRHPSKLSQFKNKFVKKEINIKTFGCTSYHQSLVAEGKADATFESGIKPGDIGASPIIIREAGGYFTNLEGKNANSRTKEIIASATKIKLKK